MHESGLIQALLHKIERVAQEERGREVVAVTIAVGVLAPLSADHLREHFTHAVAGTVAAGARLEITTLADPGDPRAAGVWLESIELAERPPAARPALTEAS